MPWKWKLARSKEPLCWKYAEARVKHWLHKMSQPVRLHRYCESVASLWAQPSTLILLCQEPHCQIAICWMVFPGTISAECSRGRPRYNDPLWNCKKLCSQWGNHAVHTWHAYWSVVTFYSWIATGIRKGPSSHCPCCAAFWQHQLLGLLPWVQIFEGLGFFFQ